jgi:pumilio RNA-binding family
VYVPHYASISTYASQFGKNGRRPNPIAPVNPSKLSPSANQFQPAMHPNNLAAYRDDHDPVFNPYASAFQSTLFANPADGRSWVPAAAPRWSPAPTPTAAQVRSRMFLRPMDPELLASPVTSPQRGPPARGRRRGRAAERARHVQEQRALLHEKSSAERQAVLLALVRACLWRPHEIQDIVHAVYDTNGLLSGVARVQTR